MDQRVRVGVGRGKGVELNYQIYGNGPNKVLFVMGLGCPLGNWKMQIDAFRVSPDGPINERFQLCAFDNRGTGRSTVRLGRYTTDMMARDALDLLSSHKIHPDAPSGGMISQKMTLMTMESKDLPRIESLTLASTHYGGPYSSIPKEGRQLSRKKIFAFTKKRKTDLSLRGLMSKSYLSDPAKYESAAKFLMETGSSSPHYRGLLSQLHAINGHSLSDVELKKMSEMGVPIGIICGSEDVLVDTRNSDALNDILHPSQYVIIRADEVGVGHANHLERPEEFNRAMIRNILRAGERSSL
ncbi:hypothetical protein PROFUN_02939 [Planoprotostelium fungivorum]|uniref:AB hydrolase-1 domain-containing protein n=1 Tax=Planoprotostelium fungivorum TaxID=1890364 RepID=A0A2P6NX99_9EUKA|nr:hypothetical protein PROFUN_02939 [Planoprotostelium fungivorum]